MIRSRIRVGVCSALAVWTASLFSPVFAATIIHTNDILGELEPCGCRTNPLGGVARERNLLKKIVEKDPSLLKLDAGDLLFASATVPETLAKQSELQAAYLLKALKLLKQDALVPGEKDFALGVATLKKLEKGSSVKFLAANLKRKKGGKLFDGHALFKRSGEKGKALNIGVIGIVGEDLAWPAELKVSSAISTARAEVQALRKKVDYLVVLTHQGYEKDLELAQAVKGIDLIIGGHTQSFLQKPVQVEKTWIYQSSFRNQYVGVIPLAKPFGVEGYQLIGLDAAYESSAEASNDVDQLVKEFKTALAKLNSEESSAQNSSAETAAGSAVKFHTFPRCAECHFKQFDFWRKTSHVHAFQALLDKQQASNKECLSCHTVGLGDPSGFSDVNRLAEFHSLPAADGSSEAPAQAKPKHPDHKELAGFLKSMEAAGESAGDLAKLAKELRGYSKSWTPVQCENCHQPGGNHPFSGQYSKKVETSACLKCHTAERAPEWYTPSGQPDLEKIQAKRAKVACPAGELSPETE
jgi:hypothetical protein